MSGTATEREPFLADIVTRIKAAESDDPAGGGEDIFYQLKQDLLDRCEPTSREFRAVASIGWDEIAARLHGNR